MEEYSYMPRKPIPTVLSETEIQKLTAVRRGIGSGKAAAAEGDGFSARGKLNLVLAV